MNGVEYGEIPKCIQTLESTELQPQSSFHTGHPSVQFFCGLLLTCVGLFLEVEQGKLLVLLGGLTMANGVVTWGGAATRQMNLLTAGFAGGVLLLALAFNFTGLSIRENHINCALAEIMEVDASIRSKLVADSQLKAKFEEMVSHRLEAFDHMLSLLEGHPDLLLSKKIDSEGASNQIKSYHNRLLWAVEDANLIEEKLTKAKDQAMAVLEKLLRIGANSDGVYQDLESKVSEHLPAGDKEKLQQRFMALFSNVEKLLTRLRLHEEGDIISGKEYNELLAAVEHSAQRLGYFIKRVEVAVGEDNTPLTHEQFLKLMHGLDEDEELDENSPTTISRQPFQSLREDAVFVAEALQRQTDEGESYSTLDNFDTDAIRKSWRRHWTNELMRLLPHDGSASDSLSDLPRKCLVGNRNKFVLVTVLICATLIQAACWHKMLKLLVSPGGFSVQRILF